MRPTALWRRDWTFSLFYSFRKRKKCVRVRIQTVVWRKHNLVGVRDFIEATATQFGKKNKNISSRVPQKRLNRMLSQ